MAELISNSNNEDDSQFQQKRRERDRRTHDVLSQFDKQLANDTIPSSSKAESSPMLKAVIRLQSFCRKELAKKIHVQKIIQKMEEEEEREREKQRRWTLESLDLLEALEATRKLQDMEILEQEKKKKCQRSASLIQSWYRWHSTGNLLGRHSSEASLKHIIDVLPSFADGTKEAEFFASPVTSPKAADMKEEDATAEREYFSEQSQIEAVQRAFNHTMIQQHHHVVGESPLSQVENTHMAMNHTGILHNPYIMQKVQESPQIGLKMMKRLILSSQSIEKPKKEGITLSKISSDETSSNKAMYDKNHLMEQRSSSRNEKGQSCNDGPEGEKECGDKTHNNDDSNLYDVSDFSSEESGEEDEDNHTTIS